MISFGFYQELFQESEDLYREAIQLDSFSLPFRCSGPTRTPPIKNYSAPDGEYLDTTRKWEWSKGALEEFYVNRKKTKTPKNVLEQIQSS